MEMIWTSEACPDPRTKILLVLMTTPTDDRMLQLTEMEPGIHQEKRKKIPYGMVDHVELEIDYARKIHYDSSEKEIQRERLGQASAQPSAPPRASVVPLRGVVVCLDLDQRFEEPAAAWCLANWSLR